MREILLSAATVAAALAIVGAIVFAGHDTGLFVPPPEAVAEEFGRQLARGRYELSRSHLSASTRRQQSARMIEERFEPARRAIGKLNQVEAAGLSREGDRAHATCELQGENGAVSLMLRLTREHGLWMVESWEAAAEISR